jgi:diaminopimelate decarboxylase
VSPAEVEYALQLGINPKDIIFTANNMTDAEMKYVHSKGVLFNIGSISRLEKYCTAYPGDTVCIRINTGVSAGEDEKLMVANPYSKFGLSMDDVVRAAQIAKSQGVRISGIHVHTGSGIENLKDIKESFTRLAHCADPKILPDLAFIDFGGGYKARYKEAEKGLNAVEFGQFVESLMKDLSARYGRDIAVYLEPGKFLVAECGYYLIQVNTLKTIGTKSIAGTNGSITHFIRILLYNGYHQVINISNPEGKKQKYDIVGNICEGSDYFAKDREVQEIREGDILMFLNAGAYVCSMASVYNMRPLPNEYILHEGVLSVSRKMDDPTSFVQMMLSSYNNI